MAKFKINKIFQITNRGSVLSGEIVEGEIRSGDTIRLETGREITGIKTKSIELLLVKSGFEEVALMVGLIDDVTTTILEEAIGKTVSITTKSTQID